MALTIHPDLPVSVVRAGNRTARGDATAVQEPAAVHHVRARPDFQELLSQAELDEPEAEAAEAADAISNAPELAVQLHGSLDMNIVDLLAR